MFRVRQSQIFAQVLDSFLSHFIAKDKINTIKTKDTSHQLISLNSSKNTP